jgi:hypothetical protein
LSACMPSFFEMARSAFCRGARALVSSLSSRTRVCQSADVHPLPRDRTSYCLNPHPHANSAACAHCTRRLAPVRASGCRNVRVRHNARQSHPRACASGLCLSQTTSSMLRYRMRDPTFRHRHAGIVSSKQIQFLRWTSSLSLQLQVQRSSGCAGSRAGITPRAETCTA